VEQATGSASPPQAKSLWRPTFSLFEVIMAYYDFDCNDTCSIVREMRKAAEELKTVEKEVAAISKICLF